WDEVAAGIGDRVGIRGSTGLSGSVGKLTATGDANARYAAGANAGYKVTSDGVQADANAGANAGVQASGSIEAKTPELQIDGVSKPLDAGVGVSGDVFAGAKVGLGGKVGLSKDYTGLELNGGAFAGG